MAKNIVGYNTPQPLFADMPSGGVTSNVVASMPIEGMDVQDQAAAYALQQRMKADRKAEWENAAAANRASLGRARPAYQKGWNVQSPEDIKLRSAFNEVYGPQISNALKYQRVQADTAEGKEMRKQRDFWTIRPEGERMKQLWTPKIGQNDITKVLDQMWRGETDPYLRAVGGGGSAKDKLRAMYPSVGGSNPAAWAARH